MWAIRSKSTSPPEIKKPRLRAPASSSAQPSIPSSGTSLKRAARLGLSLGQQLDQMACQGLHVHDGVPDRAGKGQMQPDGLILKLGPQNSGGIQQFQPLVHRDPLLSPVTPGRSPALADFFLATLLIKVDLPTLGMPTTMARTGRPTWPFSFHLAICSFSAARITGENCLTPAPLRASHSKTEIPWARKYAPQTLLAAGSAWSARLRMTTRGFPPHQLVQVRVPAGNGNPGVNDLGHHVHIFEILPDHPPGFGHVARVPLDVHVPILSLPCRGSCPPWNGVIS